MVRTTQDARPFLPDSRRLPQLRDAAAGCRGCDLYQDATQTVFGAGPARARVLMVGEQPGDVEDRKGKPFIGPAGGLLDRALVDGGIDRDEVYVTNAVKHFKFARSERGKRRIHKKPSRTEVVACRPWLLAEFESVRPELVVFLGATAAQSLFGASFKVTERRGQLLELPDEAAEYAGHGLATVHPSSVLRSRERDAAYQGLVDDLRVAATALG